MSAAAEILGRMRVQAWEARERAEAATRALVLVREAVENGRLRGAETLFRRQMRKAVRALRDSRKAALAAVKLARAVRQARTWEVAGGKA